MYNDALSAVQLNTQVNQGIGGGIAVWEVPTISYPPTPNPSVQCNVRKNMEGIPFISLINRIPRSSQLIQGYSHLRHYTSFNSRFTSCTMYSLCKHLKCHVLLFSKVHRFFSKVQPAPVFSRQSYPSLPFWRPATHFSCQGHPLSAKFCSHPLFMPLPQPFSQEDTRHCSTDCEFAFPQ